MRFLSTFLNNITFRTRTGVEQSQKCEKFRKKKQIEAEIVDFLRVQRRPQYEKYSSYNEK